MKNDKPHTVPSPIEPHPKPGRIRGIVVPAILVLGVVLVAYLGKSWWDSLSIWIDQAGNLGYLVFFLSFVALTTFCFPVSVLGFSAGAIFGPWAGLLLLFLSGVTSGTVMFALGRYFFRDRIHIWVSKRPKLAALDRLAQHRALRLNFLSRLSPLNYGVVCYTLASGKSPFPAYLAGLLATIPSMAAQVWAGSLASAAQETMGGKVQHSRLEWGLLIGGLVFFILLSWQIGRLVKEAWKEASTAEPADKVVDP